MGINKQSLNFFRIWSSLSGQRQLNKRPFSQYTKSSFPVVTALHSQHPLTAPSSWIHSTPSHERRLTRSPHTRPFSTTSPRAKVVSSPHEEIDIPNQAFAEFILSEFGKHGDREALVDGITGQSYTYYQLLDAVVKCASALTKLGFKQGDVLAIYSHNLPDYATVFIATAALGGTVTAANPLYTTAELMSQLQRSNASFICTVPESLKTAKLAVSRCPNIKEIIVFGGSGSDGCRPFSNLLQDDGKAFPESANVNLKEDLLALPYSSGTTGLPKGVMLSHHNIVSNIEQCSHDGVMSYNNDCLMGVLPFFHIYGQVVVLFTGLRKGCKIVTLPRFTLEAFLDNIQQHRATFLPMVPPIALVMAKNDLVDRYDLSSVHTAFTGAAPLTYTLEREFLERTKIPCFRQGYGLTESSPLTHCNPPDKWKPGSIGVSVPNSAYKVIDLETGEMLGPGQEGELCIRGPQIMKGYADNPKATADTVKDGWLHSGDIGYYDDEGYVYICDRLKELIKYKGFQVAPAELEGLILTHPSVEDVAVLGLRDDMAGELPRAFVKVKPGAVLSEQQLQDFVAEKVSPHKKLRGGVQFVGEVPKSASGKILRRLLKEQYMT